MTLVADRKHLKGEVEDLKKEEETVGEEVEKLGEEELVLLEPFQKEIERVKK